MRGLKLYLQPDRITRALVALLVSAWIETVLTLRFWLLTTVALLVSAWIETLHPSEILECANSRTPRECVD